MFGSFGWMELLLVLFIVLIIFGAGRIPQLGEGLGKAIKGFKKSMVNDDPTEPSSFDHNREPMGDQSEGLAGGKEAQSREHPPFTEQQETQANAPSGSGEIEEKSQSTS